MSKILRKLILIACNLFDNMVSLCSLLLGITSAYPMSFRYPILCCVWSTLFSSQNPSSESNAKGAKTPSCEKKPRRNDSRT
jgi:hypothetical protein